MSDSEKEIVSDLKPCPFCGSQATVCHSGPVGLSPQGAGMRHMKAWAEISTTGAVIRFHKTRTASRNRMVRCHVKVMDGKPGAVPCVECGQDMSLPPNSKSNPCPLCGQGRGGKVRK